MKPFIYLALLSSLLILSSTSKGQSTYVDEFTLNISSIDINRFLKGEIESGDIEVTGIKGDSIKIVAEVYNAPGKNYTCKQDECMVVDANFFHFSVKPREGEKIKKIVVRIPTNMSIGLKILGSGSIKINSIYGEVQLITNRIGNINLKDVKGPLSICGAYGDINVEFAKGISRKPMAISLVKGNIKLSISKGDAITCVSSCSDEKSPLKDNPLNQSNSFKSINGLVQVDSAKQLLEKRNMIINAKFQERIESRKFLSKGARNAKSTEDKKVFRMKENVYVYDINGGGPNIELSIYQGLIRIDERN